MDLNKLKEWILVTYTKRVILKKFNYKLDQIDKESICTTVSDYYKTFNHPFEWQIIDEIIKSVDEKFTIKEDDMGKLSYFVEKYIKIIIPEFRNSKRDTTIKKIIKKLKSIVNFY